jgi:enoyl-CoA hydratase
VRVVKVERRGAVTVVTLDRPGARNAVDGPTATALADAFRAFDADPDAAVAVLTGAGGTFCAGADLKAFAEPARLNRLQPDGDAPLGVSRLALGKPVVAAIEGHAVAGGLELACWCDLRVVAADAVLGVFCRRWGVPLIDGGTVRLGRLIGLSRAMDLVLTGRPVSADEALSFGLANRVVPSGQALAAAVELATALAALPQACLRADRASLLAAWDGTEAEALAAEFERGVPTLLHAGEHVGRFVAGAGRHGAPR